MSSLAVETWLESMVVVGNKRNEQPKSGLLAREKERRVSCVTIFNRRTCYLQKDEPSRQCPTS